MMYRSEEHVAALAQELADDLMFNPSLDEVLAKAESLCADPQLAGQVILTLAAWIPLTDTVAERTRRVAIVAGARLGLGYTNRQIPGADDTIGGAA